MGKSSTKANKCIYQIVREELGLTRADATTCIPGNKDFPVWMALQKADL